jgi:ribulose-5-phosphate 4-epimerase/fuculose-1-phosphate aldolase
LGSVPNVPYASPTTSAVPEAISPILQRCDAFMMVRHGSVVLAPTLEDGVMKTEIIEHTAKITLAAKIAGGAAPLPSTEVSNLLRLASEARATQQDRERPRGVALDALVPSPGSASRADLEDATAVEAIARAVIARLRSE